MENRAPLKAALGTEGREDPVAGELEPFPG